MIVAAPNTQRRLLALAAANAVYFAVEAGTALSFGWFSAFFDALDFFERAIALSILAITPLWSLGRRYAVTAALVLPGMIAVTAGAYFLWPRGTQHSPLSALIWVTIAVGSLALNVVSLTMLRPFRQRPSGTGRLGYIAARADLWSSAAVLIAAVATYLVRSRWPDIFASIVVVGVHLAAFAQAAASRNDPTGGDSK